MDPPATTDVLGLVGLQSPLLELVNAAVMVVDLDGVVVNANSHVERIYGWKPEDLIGRDSAEIAAESLEPQLRAEISGAVTGGHSWEGVFGVRHKEGGIVHVRVMNSALYDRAGELIGVLSIGMDATKEREMERRADEYKFLAECTTALVSAMDYGAGVRALARISAEFFGDICVIDAAADGVIHRVAAAHRDPARQPLVDRLMDYLPNPAGPHPAVRAIREGLPSYAEELSEEFLQRTANDDDHLRLVKELGFQSYVCVPLIARGRILGALTLISCSPDRRYGPGDLRLAQEMAWRAALGLDTTRLFEERTRVAQVLQASLLPPSLPQINGAVLAARYEAAEEGLDVGGDFYDVFDAGYGTWALSIGDVCGRGPQAATVTGLVRHTLRSLALKERDPARVLASLNELLNRDLTEPGMFCTVCYAVARCRPDGLHLRIASGGHPPPIILRADGRTEEAECLGLVLGPFETGRWQTCTAALQPGDSIIFYTDGVSESQAEGRQFDDGAMQETIAALAGAAPQVIANTVITAAQDFASRLSPDDMAVLVLQALSTR